MIVIKTTRDLDQILQKFRSDNKKIGFVPTMGALHDGHLTLLKESARENDFSVCSIFVNPTQFNNQQDFLKYPVTIESDIEMLEGIGCDVLFLPSVKEIYPAGHKTKFYDLGYIETILEGAFRPGHYQGVCQVVDKLLSIVKPASLYLGQKDYQQCMVIRKMIDLEKHPVKIVVVPTVRETSGLAMSSRNMRLTSGERISAAAINRNLVKMRSDYKAVPLSKLKEDALADLSAEGFKVDYLEMADSVTLEPVEDTPHARDAVILIAATINSVRLIDNMLLR